MKSFKKYMIVFSIGILAVTLLACSKKEEVGITTSKVSFSYTIENKDEGKLKLEIGLAQNSPLIRYSVIENEKEISAGEIAEGNTKAIEITTTQAKGNKYVYTLIVNDKLGNEVKKELEVNLYEDSIDEEVEKEEAEKEEIDKEPEWDGKSKDYKIGEKVSFDKKIYECIQQHTSQVDWTPIAAPSLWKEIK